MERKTFIPELKLAIFLPQQERFKSKFGGFPWGLSTELWPQCPSCGRHETFVGQFEHDERALPLGANSRVLNLFWCLSTQCVGVLDEIKNKCFLLEFEEVSTGLTRPPPATITLCEAIVIDWLEKPDQDEICLSPDFGTLEGLTEEQRRALSAYSGTKAGGIPYGLYDSGVLKDSWTFAMQIEGRHLFSGDLPSEDLPECTIGRWASPKQEMLLREKHPGRPTSALKGFGASWYTDFFPTPDESLLSVFLEQKAEKLPACYLVWSHSLTDCF